MLSHQSLEKWKLKPQREATSMTKVKKTNTATDWHACEAPAAFTR